MAYFNDNTHVPPIVKELQAIFEELPDEQLLAELRGKTRRGPKGYNPKILWHCFIAYYALGLPSVSEFIRTVQNNPYIAEVCGIDYPNGIPDQSTFSRFFTRLSRRYYRPHINRVFSVLTNKLYDTFPNFGKSVAMDATDIKAWSNGAHRKPTDKNAGWVIKADTNGRGKFTWGYKANILVDTQYELPMALKVTSGNVHEIKSAAALLSKSRKINGKFNPDYVIADSGYSSKRFRQQIQWHYHATPIIKNNPSHKKAIEAYPETPEWQLIYNRRTSVERVFSRLKGHRKLNYVRVRGIQKVTIHCLLSLIVIQSQALAKVS
ncbi:transposase [Chloroflexota bacterium]